MTSATKAKATPASTVNGARTFDLTEHAMIVHARVSVWSAMKRDSKIAEEVADNHGANKDMLSTRKRLLPKESLEKMKKIGRKARGIIYKWSLPWTDGGYRIISAEGYMAFANEWREVEAEWDREFEIFKQNYPSYRKAAEKKLGSLYNEKELPPPERLDTKFGLKIEILPVPKASDFRVEMSEAAYKKTYKQVEETINELVEESMKDIWQRMFEVVSHMVERLNAYEVDDEGKVVKTFRDTLVSNIAELLDLIPALNITKNKDVDKFASRMRKELCKFTAEELREDEEKRTQTAQLAEEILSKMEAYI